MIQLDWSLGASALIFLITLFALNRILFRPLFAALDERKAKTEDVFQGADESADRYQAMVDEYERRIKEGRQAGYQHSETVRNEALKIRQEKILAAREESEELLKIAKQDITKDLQDATDNLRRELEQIAALISERILKGA